MLKFIFDINIEERNNNTHSNIKSNELTFLGNKRNNIINNEYNSYNSDNEIKEKLFIDKKIQIKIINDFVDNAYINLKSFINKNVDFKKEAIKYNKHVYISSLLTNDKKKEIKNNNVKTRKSKYRGVSKNGNGWQSITMFKKKKLYLGTFDSEELAAIMYDFESIKNKGIKAQTNFPYNKEQFEKIIKMNIDYKNPNLSIITDLHLPILNKIKK